MCLCTYCVYSLNGEVGTQPFFHNVYLYILWTYSILHKSSLDPKDRKTYKCIVQMQSIPYSNTRVERTTNRRDIIMVQYSPKCYFKLKANSKLQSDYTSLFKRGTHM